MLLNGFMGCFCSNFAVICVFVSVFNVFNGFLYVELCVNPFIFISFSNNCA